MNASSDSYWSIEACGWAASPARSMDLPEPREADPAADLGAETAPALLVESGGPLAELTGSS